MFSSRARAFTLTGAAVLLPLVSTAQEARLPRIDSSTPLSEINALAQTARIREIRHTMLRVFYSAMGAPVPMSKRPAGHKADYYDAWRARIHDRAFPNETIDAGAYTRAVERRLQMPAPPSGSSSGSTRNRSISSLAASGTSWEPVGPTRTQVPYVTFYGPANSYVSGRVGGIAFDPIDPNIVYKTGAAGGIFKTTNGGVNWTPLVSGIRAPYMSAIAVSPTDRNLIIAGTGDFDGGVGVGDGLYRSTNGGATWTSIAREQIANAAFSDIVFDKSTPGRILATAGRRGYTNGRSSSGLWESTNYGLTWTKRFVSIPVAGEDLSLGGISFGAADASGKQTVVVAREYPAGVYVSRNGGRNWSEIANYPGRKLDARNVAVASPTNPDVIYAAEEWDGRPDGDGRVYKGVRTGSNWAWTDITGNLPNGYNWSQSSYDMHMGVAKHTVNGVTRDTVYLGLITIAAWNGSTWTDIGVTYTGSAKTHNDQHTFAVFPGDQSKMAIGNDGGIYGLTVAPNGTHTINARMNGDSSMAMFYSGAWHPTDPNRMFGGTQDNASPAAIGDLANWANRTGGDGTGAAIDGQNPSRQYGSSQFLGMSRTFDAWTTQNGFRDFTGAEDPEGLPFIGRFSADKSPEGMLYVGTNSRIHQYNASTNIWTDYLGSQSFVGQVRAIAAAPTDPRTIYVGTTFGRLYVTRDRGLTWVELPGSGAMGSVTSFAVHPTKPRDVLVTSGSGSGNVYRISDRPSPPLPLTPMITQVSGGGGGALPNIFTSAITRNQGAPDTTWYVANDVGVFGTVNGGNTWFNMTETLGLPAVEASAIEHTPGTGYLNLATYGRGMWRLKVTDVRAPALMTVTATIRRTANNVIAVTLRLTNTGTAAATLTKALSADLVFPASAYGAFTIAPANIGTIAPGASRDVTVTYRDDYLRRSGLSGVVVPNITWISGNETLGFRSPVPVTLP